MGAECRATVLLEVVVRRLACAWFLAGCLSTDAEVDDLLFQIDDRDGDGYADMQAGGDDCDDSDPSVNPEASEQWYDGVDQDCQFDSDYDRDGDGYDSDEYGGTDCNDAREDVHPGHPEVCHDGTDNDCDTTTPESDCE